MSASPRHAQIERELSSFRIEQPDCDDTPPSVRVATEYIHDHLFDPELTVKRLRNQLGLTDSMFSPRFRLYHGRTPGRYIQHLRVEAAKRLLRRFDELRIAEIALYVGYEHYRTFARLFKRVTGHSPQAYRDQKETST